MKSLVGLLPLLSGVAAAPTPSKAWFKKRFGALRSVPAPSQLLDGYAEASGERWSTWGSVPLISVMPGVDEGTPCDADFAAFQCGGKTKQVIQYCHEGRWINVHNCRSSSAPGTSCIAPLNTCSNDNWDNILFTTGDEWELVGPAAPGMWQVPWWSDGVRYRDGGFPGTPVYINRAEMQTAGVAPLHEALSMAGVNVPYVSNGWGRLTTAVGTDAGPAPTAPVTPTTELPTTAPTQTTSQPPPPNPPTTATTVWPSESVTPSPSETPTAMPPTATTTAEPWSSETPTTEPWPTETSTTEQPPTEAPRTEPWSNETETVPQPSDTPIPGGCGQSQAPRPTR
ncbi:hypothetical protein CspeluHIS016_0103010 [Cutaneotrichosporon spelunceum]|uniref:Uncharacterized protein n=1 Tax=Cutaneotrichosporon spelunceum TaxID=1672016 RepID=A0AAD3TN31_9TREE|nr:hypothetical protein CspeluHIS016_0103010 [Cutaneotrichosporon spelunceum]